MAKKKGGEAISFQIECETEIQWRSLSRKEGLTIVDVYPGWIGPCVSMINIFKRIKVEVNDDRLHFATACSDKIDDLLMFKDQSEPTWLFLGSGKPVKVLRGCHVPNLAKAIRQELEHEIQCMEGKTRRNLISIDDEESRKKKLEAEAHRLAEYLTDEEPKDPLGLEEEVVKSDSSVEFATVMSAYTVAVIQPFAKDKVPEISDYLSADFTILRKLVVNLDEDGARKLYRLPYEKEEQHDFGFRESQVSQSFAISNTAMEGDDENAEDGAKPKKKKHHAPKKHMIPLPLPDGLVGETTLILLESTEVKKRLDSGGRHVGLLQTADDWLRLKVGPHQLKAAMEHSPYSLHATYGKGEFLPAIFCPRRYDDRRYMLMTYFPEFIIFIMMPDAADHIPMRYVVFVYPGARGTDIGANNDVKSHGADIYASGRLTIPPDVSDKMVRPWKIPDEEVEQKKLKISSAESFCLSVNGKNEALLKLLIGLGPLHYSVDAVHGAQETSALFPNLDAKYEEDPNDLLNKLLGRAPKRIPDIYVPEPEFEDEPTTEDQESSGAATAAAGAEGSPPATTDKPPSPEGGDKSEGGDVRDASEAGGELGETEEDAVQGPTEEGDDDEAAEE